MKRGKRAAAVALAIGLAVTGSMASFADTPGVKEVGGLGADGTANSTLTGTINITNIQVEVPIKASFDIDPNVAITADTTIVTSTDATNTNQITGQASNYTIKNLSKVPLVVSITGIKTNDGTTDGIPELVNTMDDLTGKNVMFAVRKNGEAIKYPAAATDSTQKWMMADAIKPDSPYYVTEGGASANVLGPVGSSTADITMKLYGATGDGWRNGESFDVIPTFTIALQSASS